MILESNLGGDGGPPKLAPDLNYISNSINSTSGYAQITGIDGSSGLTTALSITGKYAVCALGFVSTTAESVTIKLTIDGVVIINDTFTAATSISILNVSNGLPGSSTTVADIGAVVCNSSLLLEIQTASDTDVSLNYIVRPIL